MENPPTTTTDALAAIGLPSAAELAGGGAEPCPQLPQAAPLPKEEGGQAAPLLSPKEEAPFLLLWRLYMGSILGYCEGFDSGEDYQCAGAIWLARLAVALRPPAPTEEAWLNALTLLFVDIPASSNGPWNTWLKNYDILEGLDEAAGEAARCGGKPSPALLARKDTGKVGEDARARFEEVKKNSRGEWQVRIQLVRREAMKVTGDREENGGEA